MEAVGIEPDPPKNYTDEELAPYLGPLEGILFTMGNSVEIERLAEALEVEEDLVIRASEKLAAEYEEKKCGVRISRLENSLQMCTAPDIYEYLIRIAKQPKKYVLTDVLLESLSIVAYKQPITRAEVEKIRGVDCSHAMNKLVEYGLIEEVGRMDAPGRPILFGTTEDFLRSFGVTSLEELPALNPVQVDEFRAEAENEISLTLEV
ncbi:MAG: SMC-Scp complex subunit ScpB [Lachnospiraceae bacterium]|nr:SMC-Scp complex subunit ScpB [Lachnospiraceae bacterium]